ncbi:hypothetical protein [Vibrio eleionomae]|uniref:hypothetical protein n=1 Tax=Vibrio eleionomae TaxID=2653505 RepID=UPI00136F9198|nr:hypothetical protein [Vibrio eleionomae]
MKVGKISKSAKNLIQQVALTVLGWIAQSGQAIHPFKGSERLIDAYHDDIGVSTRNA